MASVWTKGPSWYVKYKDGTGRYRQVRTTARTKTEARRIGLELERAAERQRLGLEELPADSAITLGELVRWWLKERCSDVSRVREESRLRRHVLEHSLAREEMRHLTGAQIDERLREMERAGYAPGSVEHVRRKLRAVVNAARKAGRWRGPSPLAGDDAPEARAVPKRRYELLAAEEVPLVLRHIAPQWRAVMAAAVYTATRKGEILALRKRDVDLRAGLITVARSWGRDRTKGDEHATIPIAAPLLPYLQAAIRESPSELVFPRADGSMHPEAVNLTSPLRTAIARAGMLEEPGLLEGWRHVCRRCKGEGRPTHTWRHDGGENRRCPSCDMRLWPTPLPRPVRWHDLRHTTATLLLRSGVAIQHVQRLLRHADVQTTVGTYGHIVAEDLRATLARLPGAEVSPDATRLLPSESAEKETPKSPRKSAAKSGVSVAGDVGLEPTTFGFEGQRERFSARHNAAQKVAIPSNLAHLPAPLEGAEYQPVTARRRNLATVELPMLSVREVAARLGVSTATVYGLVKRRELQSTRVSGAHRIHPADLEAYLSRGR